MEPPVHEISQSKQENLMNETGKIKTPQIEGYNTRVVVILIVVVLVASSN